MPVRLLKPYLGQNAGTVYDGPLENFLRAVGIADDYYELAVNYAPVGTQPFRSYATTFSTEAPAGAVVSTFTDPFAGQGRGRTTYAIQGTTPPQFAISATGRSLVTGSTPGVDGTTYSLTLVATSGDGLLSTQPVTLNFKAVARLAVPNPGTPTPSPTPTLLTRNARVVYDGDSEFATSANVQTYPTLIGPLSGGRLRMPLGWNNAVGGTTSTQMLARIGNVTTAAPDAVVVLDGTNDTKGSDANRDITISNLASYRDQVLASGVKYIVFGTILPRFGGNALNAADEVRRSQINDAIRSWTSDPRVKVANCDPLNLQASDFIDGLHPNQFGQYKVAQVFAAVLNSITDSSTVLDRYNLAENVLFSRGKDPSFSAGGGTIDNTGAGSINGVTTAQAGGATDAGIPLGWLVTNPTSLAITVSRVDTGQGFFKTRIQGSGTPADLGSGNAGRIQLRATITRSPAAAAGQVNEQWVGVDQAANMQNVGDIGMLSTTSLDYSPGRSQNTGAATGNGLPALSYVKRSAQIGAYGSTGLTSFTQYLEIFLATPGVATQFDVSFYQPYSTLVTAG